MDPPPGAAEIPRLPHLWGSLVQQQKGLAWHSGEFLDEKEHAGRAFGAQTVCEGVCGREGLRYLLLREVGGRVKYMHPAMTRLGGSMRLGGLGS